MNDSYRKGKMLSRHNSMPLTVQPPLDDTYSQEKDCVVLVKELRKKSIKIYELEEKCDEKDTRIYALELEKSKMRMTFDKLRVEMYDLKEKERDYKQMLAVSPPNRMLRNVGVQTDEDGKIIVYTYHSDPRARVSTGIPEITFNANLSPYANQSFNQTEFSDFNNASSDNLIPVSEISLEDINLTRTVEQAPDAGREEEEGERKKTKKFRRFFKLMPCVSKK